MRAACGPRVCFLVEPIKLGSLSNYDNDGNNNVTNWHTWQYAMKSNSFARLARAFFIFGQFADVLVLSTTWNHLFCSCVDDVSIWWPIFNLVFLTLILFQLTFSLPSTSSLLKLPNIYCYLQFQLSSLTSTMLEFVPHSLKSLTLSLIFILYRNKSNLRMISHSTVQRSSDTTSHSFKAPHRVQLK